MAKILGLQPRTAAVTGGVVLVAAVGYFWWRNRQSQQQAATPAASTGCTDSSGNSVPCPDATGIDYSGELSVIQAELESLMAAQGADTDTDTDGTGTTKTKTVTVPNVKGKAVTAAVAEIKAAGLVAGPHPASGTVTGQTPAGGAKVKAGSKVDLDVASAGVTVDHPGQGAPGAVTDLRTSNVTAGGFRARWRKPAGTTHYTYDVTYQGKLVKSGNVTASAVTVSGLVRDHTYTFRVRACDHSGCGPEAQAAVKTRG